MTIYRMNKKAELITRTPARETGEFAISKIIKQGTIHAPVLCSAETAQVNNGKEMVEYHYGPVKIRILVFMDDVMGAGTIERMSSYRYLGLLVNEEGDLEEHMKGKT